MTDQQNNLKTILITGALTALSLFFQPAASAELTKMNLPSTRIKAELTFAPDVPAPINRSKPAVVEVHLNSSVKRTEIKSGVTYDYWTFNDHVPGPFIRVRVGDVIEVHHTNSDESGMPHNIDFHAVTGPGGGAPVTTVVKGEKRIAWFKMRQPGLYIYHCAAPPVMDHIANGMYGLILVEPQKGLPKVDKEFYVLQSEVYGEFDETKVVVPPEDEGDHFFDEEMDMSAPPEIKGHLKFSHQKGLDEHPQFVMFNGAYNRLTGAGSIKAKVGDKVRIFFGNAGPNLISSFHVIGEIFDNVYREADLVSEPGHNIQTTLVPAGGASMVEFNVEVPGTYTLVDHAIFRIEKGAVGYLEVEGAPNYDIYAFDGDPVLCPGCLVHP